MKSLLIALLALPISTSAYALDVTQTGVNLHVTYTEPTTTENGTPLDDLATTDATAKDGGGNVVATHQEPASALAGGGAIAFDLVVDVPLGQKQIITVEVTATDLVGNISQPATSIITIDREAPGAPN